jgi:hypothetical protein
MKTKSFVPLFAIPVAAVVKSRKIHEKNGAVTRLLPQTHGNQVFNYKCVLKSLDNMCISTFVNINLIQYCTRSD